VAVVEGCGVVDVQSWMVQVSADAVGVGRIDRSKVSDGRTLARAVTGTVSFGSGLVSEATGTATVQIRRR